MYKNLKKVIKKIVPKALIYKNEKFLRSVIALKYKGNTFKCNICEFKLSQFIENERGGRLCPKCGSVSRSRRLWHILKDEVEGKVMLHFSPSLKLSQNIKNSKVKEYITTDYVGEFNANKQLDIENINEPDQYFDCIVCFHILEHIKLDTKAMSELFRILKPNGTCYIQTPFKDGTIYEDDTIISKVERLKHFGQEDHVRIYSVSGLIERLHNVGFTTETLHFTNAKDNLFGFSENETIIKAFRN